MILKYYFFLHSLNCLKSSYVLRNNIFEKKNIMYVFSFATHTLFLEVFVHTYNNYVQNMALQSMKLKMYTVFQKIKKKNLLE
jgi:hypothetical protein